MEICLGGRIIKARKNGPYEIRGEVQLIDFQGHPIPPPADGSIFLCRCGGSSIKKNAAQQGRLYRVLRRPVSNRPSPRMAATTPAIKSQKVRSLGAPVKSSDKREPNEAEACIPKMISTTPTTNKAIPTTLCIPSPPSLCVNNSQRSSPTSPDYIRDGHRASWLRDLHARPLTAHPPSWPHYPAQW